MKIIVIGAGAWGTALAVAAGPRPGAAGSVASLYGASSLRPHDVVLWARDPVQAAALDTARENRRYLPGIALPHTLQIASGDLVHTLHGAGLVIVATPMAGLRSMLEQLRGIAAPVAWLCKGFESPRTTGDRRSSDAAAIFSSADNPHAPADASVHGLLGHELCAAVAPDLLAGVLSGPSFALEVARGQPTALVAASVHAAVRDALVQAFHGPALRVYASSDVVGVEVGGAVKNVLAIATGLCDGLGLGLNARAALVTRGLAEMTRLGVALGAQTETFMGLSGLGDLVLTATGDLSRNRQVGLSLAQGRGLQQAVESLGHVAEGVYSARTVLQRARVAGVDMPITESVVALLDGRLRPLDAVAALMGRGPASEIG